MHVCSPAHNACTNLQVQRVMKPKELGESRQFVFGRNRQHSLGNHKKWGTAIVVVEIQGILKEACDTERESERVRASKRENRKRE